MYQPEKYSLEIISRLKEFNGKALKKYKLEGIETVGAWGNEPFEIVFKNHTYQKVQVKISMDGTDILTSETATTEPTDKMWVVNAKDSLILKAWPETNNGGAQFVFASADKSVALHTHGDMSHRGIIAAAVYTEGHVEPVRLNNNYHYYNSFPYYSYPILNNHTTCGGMGSGSFGYGARSKGIQSAGNSILRGTTSTISTQSLGETDCSVSFNAANTSSDSINLISDVAETLVAVGAGEYTDQKITYTTGLIKPLFTESIRVKYVWWDDLVSTLKSKPPASPQPSGFPGDKPHMSLGTTPRINTSGSVIPREQPRLEFTRF